MSAWNDALVTENGTDPDLRRQLDQALGVVDTLQESMARLELNREDIGWQLLTQQGQHDMTRKGIVDRAQFHRVLFAGNPLAKRGGQLRAAFVFGDGLGFTGDDDRVNAVLQEHVDDTTNRNQIYGAPALERLENACYTDGNVFIANPTDPLTGKVTHRVIPVDEITEIISAPGDSAETWYYIRQWTEYNPEARRTIDHTRAYPHIRHAPVTKHKRIMLSATSEQAIKVDWSTPVLHVAPNRQTSQKWGLADMLPVVPWAEKYKEFLLDWSQLMKALQKIAWAVHGENSSQSQQMRAQAARMGDLPAGSTAAITGEGRLQAVSKSGATIDADSAKPILAMVAAGLGLPLTMLSNDPGQVGSHNTASTLTPPMQKLMRARQGIWSEAFRQLVEYVLLQAVQAPRGALRRYATPQRVGNTVVLTERSQRSLTFRIDFPSLDDDEMSTIVDALAKIKTMDVVPDEIILREALRAIGVKQVDEVLDKMRDASGNFLPPSMQNAQAAGTAAADALRRGGDPTEYL